MAEDARVEFCADWRTSKEAAAGVEFRVEEEALLAGFEDAASLSFDALLCASVSWRGGSTEGGSPVVEDSTSPRALFASDMADAVNKNGQKSKQRTGQKTAKRSFQGRRGLSPGLLWRKSPSNADISAAWESPDGAYPQTVGAEGPNQLISNSKVVELMEPMAPTASGLWRDGSKCVCRVGGE